MRIPFNKTEITGREYQYLRALTGSINNEEIPNYYALCRREIERLVNRDRVYLTNSCSAALETAALLISIKPGDEVIVPAFTFPSTVNPFLRQGAEIIFADSQLKNPSIDDQLFERLITKRTKAVVVVHYGGMPCKIDEIKLLSEKYGLILIEDAAHAYGASINKRPLGTIGDIGCISFHSTKNVHCYEGGALIIDNQSLISNVDTILDKGTNREEFLRGEVNQYEWKGYGSAFRLSELHSAFLLAQLEKAEEIRDTRRSLWQNYYYGLNDLERESLITLPTITDEEGHNGHIFYLILRDREERNMLKAFLLERGIYTAEHYGALDNTPFWKDRGIKRPSCQNAKILSETLLRLPIYNSMTLKEQGYIMEAIHSFFRLK